VLRKNILGMLPSELASWLLGEGEPPYRARQILRWVYGKRVASFLEMSDIPLPLREKLSSSFSLGSSKILEVWGSQDGTKKFLVGFSRGDSVEVVTIPQRGWCTACLSTQVGCPVRCPFCATGRAGFRRSLSAEEIAEELWVVKQKEGRITHLVFMGMGEPLLNYEELTKALRIFNSPEGFGIGSRRITVSTVGIPEGVVRLARDWPEINLALSLHAPFDELRNFLVPINRAYPLKALLGALKEYLRLTRRRVTIEYTLWQGINDEREHALALARLLRGLLVHVNLIPGNRVPGTSFLPSSAKRLEIFATLLRGEGITVTLRRSRGHDIRAACGELYRIHGLEGEIGDDHRPEERHDTARD
jgi:23S rRNA (adenine2503-C2)-methyltransferase